MAPEAQLRSFVARLGAKNQKLFQSVRSAIRKRFPTANELVYDYPHSLVIGYSPTGNGIESVVSIATREDGVELYFNNGPKLPDPKKLLLGKGKATRFVRLESARQLKHPDVAAFIAAAIGLSNVPLPAEGKGSVTIKTNQSAAAKRRTGPKAKK
jgi:hypothetical protein